MTITGSHQGHAAHGCSLAPIFGSSSTSGAMTDAGSSAPPSPPARSCTTRSGPPTTSRPAGARARDRARTSWNQGFIDEDLAAFAPRGLELPHAEARHWPQQLTRSYDPCTGCATHFMDLSVEEGEA